MVSIASAWSPQAFARVMEASEGVTLRHGSLHAMTVFGTCQGPTSTGR